MKNPKAILPENLLIEGIKRRRLARYSKIKIVKYVWENTDWGLKDSKEFVDKNLK